MHASLEITNKHYFKFKSNSKRVSVSLYNSKHTHLSKLIASIESLDQKLVRTENDDSFAFSCSLSPITSQSYAKLTCVEKDTPGNQHQILVVSKDITQELPFQLHSTNSITSTTVELINNQLVYKNNVFFTVQKWNRVFLLQDLTLNGFLCRNHIEEDNLPNYPLELTCRVVRIHSKSDFSNIFTFILYDGLFLPFKEEKLDKRNPAIY